ncbi:hypothetical protein J7J74_01610 [bacterium]|nr:hypothetical protein [bacterium]
MSISTYDHFKVWDNASVASGDHSDYIYVHIAEILGVYFKLSASVDIALEAYIKDQWIEVYRWENPGTDWVFDAFVCPLATSVRLKALGSATVTAYFTVKR